MWVANKHGLSLSNNNLSSIWHVCDFSCMENKACEGRLGGVISHMYKLEMRHRSWHDFQGFESPTPNPHTCVSMEIETHHMPSHATALSHLEVIYCRSGRESWIILSLTFPKVSNLGYEYIEGTYQNYNLQSLFSIAQ